MTESAIWLFQLTCYGCVPCSLSGSSCPAWNYQLKCVNHCAIFLLFDSKFEFYAIRTFWSIVRSFVYQFHILSFVTPWLPSTSVEKRNIPQQAVCSFTSVRPCLYKPPRAFTWRNKDAWSGRKSVRTWGPDSCSKDLLTPLSVVHFFTGSDQ